MTIPTQLPCRVVSWEWKPLSPTFADVLVPGEEKNSIVLNDAHHVLAPSETTLHGEHCVLATDLMARRGIRECVSLDMGPHKTVVGYLHKHLK